MSTLKSSAEDLTLNADGSGNDIIFQSNGSNVATLDQAGLLTATTFAGSAASLTAIPAANITGTLPAIDGSSLTGIAGRKNMVINGDMRIAQRGTSFTVAGSHVYTLDRWAMRCDATTITATHSSDSPTGFATSLKLTNGTGSSGSGTDSCYLRHSFEGYNTNHLEIGTANAKTVTLSFWVKSSITGTYIVTFLDSGSDNGYPASYTISSADTWEKKTITLTLSDYGSWVGSSTTARNLTVHFDFGSGSDRDLTSLNAWNDGATNDFSHSSQVDWVGTTGATLYLTGVQLELGSAATDFEHRSYGEELSLCERYYHRHTANIAGAGICAGGIYSTTAAAAAYRYPTIMRTNPTLSYSGVGDFRVLHTTTHVVTAIDGIETVSGVRLWFTSSGMTAGNGMMIDANNPNCWLAFDAEL